MNRNNSHGARLFVLLAMAGFCFSTAHAQLNYTSLSRGVTTFARNPCDNDQDDWFLGQPGPFDIGATAFVQQMLPNCGSADFTATQSTTIASDSIEGSGTAIATTSPNASGGANSNLGASFTTATSLHYLLEGDTGGFGFVRLRNLDGNLNEIIAELDGPSAMVTGVLAPGEYNLQAVADIVAAGGADLSSDFTFSFTVSVPEPSSLWGLASCCMLALLMRKRCRSRARG